MFLFSKIEGNTVISTTSAGLDSNASVLAVKQSNNKAAILVVNGNPTTNINVKPDQSQTWSTANLWLLQDDSCYDPSPTINGFSIGPGGAWSGTPTSISRGQGVIIPPCGAALVQIQ
jgi:hypothetical protein